MHYYNWILDSSRGLRVSACTLRMNGSEFDSWPGLFFSGVYVFVSIP